MAAPALPAEVRQLREQLLRDQAPSARQRTEVYDPAVFVSRYGRPYSSLRLPLSTLKEMRTDAILRFAQLTALVSIFAAKWHIDCADARKAQFIDHALRRIIGRLIVQFFESWNFGWQSLVKEFGLLDPGWEFLDKNAEGGPKVAKVWDGSPQPALVWEPFVPLPPESVAPVWTQAGAFNGIAVNNAAIGGGYGLPMTSVLSDDVVDVPPEWMGRFTSDDQRQKVDLQNSLWVTNERDGQWGRIWGFPRLAYAFKYWWSGELALGILNRSVEKKGDPTIIVAFPTGSSTVRGQEVSNRDIAFDIGSKARSGSVLAVPSEVWGDDMATANQAPKWKVETLKLEADFDSLVKVMGYFDTMKFRAMLVSELALAEGSGGCLDGDTPILCPRDHGAYPDGVPLEDVEPGRLVWAFNEQSMRFELWPVKGVWRTMDDADLYKLTLDSGQEIVGTQDHPFMSRDGVWRRMDELKPGDRLMPFYESGREMSYSGYGLAEDDYEPMVLTDPDHGSFEVEYRIIGDYFGWTGRGREVNIHHDDGRHANTEVENLQLLTPSDHAFTHFRDPVHRQKHSDAVRAAMAALSPEKRARMNKEHWDEQRWKAFRERQAIVGLEAVTKFRDSLTPDEYKAWCTARAQSTLEAKRRNGTTWAPPRDKRNCRDCGKEYQPKSGRSLYCQTCHETRRARKTDRVMNWKPKICVECGHEYQPTGGQQKLCQECHATAPNHRVVSVERLGETGAVWDLEIDGPPHVRNFVAGGVVVHNTSSRNVASVTGERTAEAQIFTQTEWDEVINRYMIPQLSDANFPELKDVPARKVTQAFGEDEANLAADLIRSMANANPALLPVDWKAALERFQVDSLEGDQLAAFEKRLIKQAEASTPPKVEAQPNGAAGVTDTGFYYDARERIELEDDALLAALPKTKVYADRAVLAQTRLVRKLWFSTLTDAYESAAKHLESTGLALADDAQAKADKVAERVLKSWRFSYAKTIKSVVVALGRILARAGSLELSSSRVKTDAWNPEDKTVVAWARDNAAALVRSVDETTRDQLRTFLASEIEAGHDAASIAKNLRAHFAQFPSWRADLIAREETKRYYNAGTLFAAEAVEAQVQALDALHGPTDHECEKRNGRLFDVSDAWQESAKEHVRGTLCWRIIPGAQLSLRTVKSAEVGDVIARVDLEKREILLAEGLDPEEEGRYLVQVVDWLTSQ